MSDIRTILKFVAVGYVALVVLAVVVGPVGPSPLAAIFVLGAVAWIWWYRNQHPSRRNEQPTVIVSVEPVRPSVALPPPEPAIAAKRLDAVERELPEDPLTSPLMVELAPLYEHEPPEEVARLEDTYRAERARLEACRRSLERGEQIDAELVRLEKYVAELRATAGEVGDDPVAAALEATGRARETVSEARSAVAALDAPHADVGKPLAEAETALQEAHGAFATGKERPLLALRRAREAERLANEVRGRARRVRGLPGELERRLGEFERSAARADRELARVKEEFGVASEQYAPSCWSEMRGVAASAERAAERARRSHAAAAAKATTDPAAAKEELDGAFASLDRVRSLADTIDKHLARLERASLTARDRVAAAEQLVESAWRSGDHAAEAAPARARSILDEARAEHVVGTPSTPAVPDDQLEGALADARVRVRRIRDETWAQGIVTEAVDSTVRPLLDEMERAYQGAEAAAAEAAAGGRAGLERAIEAYEYAERRARAVRRQVDDAYTDSIDRRKRSIRGAGPPASPDGVTWTLGGTFGIKVVGRGDDPER
jgi:colicin import membrane protein